ncbi:hypothetical protein MUK42_11882, partial [Musa troglodytarum]
MLTLVARERKRQSKTGVPRNAGNKVVIHISGRRKHENRSFRFLSLCRQSGGRLRNPPTTVFVPSPGFYSVAMESKHLPTFGPSSVFAMAYGSPLAFFFSSFALLVASIPGLVPVGVAEPSFYDPSRVTQLFWRPRIFLYKGFLSDEERDHIIKLVGEEQDDEVDCGGQRVREGPDEQRADELRRVPTEASGTLHFLSLGRRLLIAMRL